MNTHDQSSSHHFFVVDLPAMYCHKLSSHYSSRLSTEPTPATSESAPVWVFQRLVKLKKLNTPGASMPTKRNVVDVNNIRGSGDRKV
jgi:hypothetical protein